MKKLAVAAILIASSAAGAATYYKDRIIPGSPPCMISVQGQFVNAVMIKSVAIGDFIYSRPTGNFFGRYEYFPRKVMRIELITHEVIDTFDGDLNAALADVLKKIESCSK